MELLKRLVVEEEGQGLVEYSLIVLLVALVFGTIRFHWIWGQETADSCPQMEAVGDRGSKVWHSVKLMK
jgi:hypothetical protein